MDRKVSNIKWYDVDFNEGFWKKWQDIAQKNTSKAIYNRFSETGRIKAMDLQWKEGEPNKPHVFWDSDIAKWMEGSAAFLTREEDPELKAKVDDIISKIERGQSEDGYFNSAYLTLHPQLRFTDRTEHELYTAGHFIEAAVVYYEATKDDRFLLMMERFADLIEKVFIKDKSAPYRTPGHQELELALVRLYRATGKKKYLEAAKYFVETRGTDPVDKVFSVPNGTPPAFPPLKNQLLYDDTYAQDDAPAKDLRKAGGHAVRAMYFYTAMADIAMEYGDEELLEACRSLWSDSVNHKMYVTGGVSAERFGEAIGTDYVLPNDLAYAETCASVAMSNFSLRMFDIEKDGKYCDMIERQMYNGALSGLQMDGKAFYYDNALQVRTRETDFFTNINARPLYPAYVRQPVFECSCCPPNIYRFIAELGQYFYSVLDDCLFINQYSSSVSSIDYLGSHITLTQKTGYPFDGKILIKTEGSSGIAKLAVRIPALCTKWSISVNGDEINQMPVKGYIYLNRDWKDGDSISIDLEMPVVELTAHPDVIDAHGKVALQRGPIVYTVEGADNEGLNLFRLMIRKDSSASDYSLFTKTISGHDVVCLKTKALYEDASGYEDRLYKPYKPEYSECEVTAIPYFAWANRGANDMSVWLRKQF